MELQQSDQWENWTASLADKLAADETNESRFGFSTKPEFKCVLCKKDIVRSPVFQCHVGHLACSSCSHRGRSCTFCNNAISRIKNVAIGAIIDSLYVTCKYESLGCKDTYELNSYMDHEKTCGFTPIGCPMPNCKQAGVKNSLEQHLKSKHDISAFVDIRHCMYLPYAGLASFFLDSIPTKVVLHSRTEDFYLLQQVTTDIGDRLHISPLTDSRKLKKCKIEAEMIFSPETNVEIKNCFKMKSRTNFDEGGLLIPRQESGTGASKTKLYKIFFYDD